MSAIVWWLAHSLVLCFLGTEMRIDLFQSCGHCWVFQICWHNECKTLMGLSFKDLNCSAGISLYPLALLTAVLLPSGHVWLWELDCKEGRMPKNWCLWTVVLGKTECPLDSLEIKPINLKGDQLWIFTGKTDAEAESPVFLSSDANRQLIEKVPDPGKDWGQKEKRASEDEMAGWYHQCNEHELGQTLGGGEGQGGLVCCSPWAHRELDTTGRLNNMLHVLKISRYRNDFSSLFFNLNKAIDEIIWCFILPQVEKVVRIGRTLSILFFLPLAGFTNGLFAHGWVLGRVSLLSWSYNEPE